MAERKRLADSTGLRLGGSLEEGERVFLVVLVVAVSRQGDRALLVGLLALVVERPGSLPRRRHRGLDVLLDVILDGRISLPQRFPVVVAPVVVHPDKDSSACAGTNWARPRRLRLADLDRLGPDLDGLVPGLDRLVPDLDRLDLDRLVLELGRLVLDLKFGKLVLAVDVDGLVLVLGFGRVVVLVGDVKRLDASGVRLEDAFVLAGRCAIGWRTGEEVEEVGERGSAGRVEAVAAVWEGCVEEKIWEGRRQDAGSMLKAREENVPVFIACLNRTMLFGPLSFFPARALAILSFSEARSAMPFSR